MNERWSNNFISLNMESTQIHLTYTTQQFNISLMLKSLFNKNMIFFECNVISFNNFVISNLFIAITEKRMSKVIIIKWTVMLIGLYSAIKKSWLEMIEYFCIRWESLCIIKNNSVLSERLLCHTRGPMSQQFILPQSQVRFFHVDWHPLTESVMLDCDMACGEIFHD